MAQEMQTTDMCNIGEDVAKKMKKIRFRGGKKTAAAMILKIKSSTNEDGVRINEIVIEDDEIMEDVTAEELQEQLSDTQPRYIIYSYVINTFDNRQTFPLLCLYYHPRGCSTQQMVLYAGSLRLVEKTLGSERTIEFQEKEDFTDEFMYKKLGHQMPSSD